MKSCIAYIVIILVTLFVAVKFPLETIEVMRQVGLGMQWIVDQIKSITI